MSSTRQSQRLKQKQDSESRRSDSTSLKTQPQRISVAIQTTKIRPRKTTQCTMTSSPTTTEHISSENTTPGSSSSSTSSITTENVSSENPTPRSSSSSTFSNTETVMLPDNYIKFLTSNKREPIWEHAVRQWIDNITASFTYFGIIDPDFKLKYVIQSFTPDQYARMEEFMPDRDTKITKDDYDNFIDTIKQIFELNFIDRIEALGPKCKNMTLTQIYSLICRTLDFHASKNPIPEQILRFYFVQLVPEPVAIFVRRLFAKSGTKRSISQIVDMAETFWDTNSASGVATNSKTTPQSDTRAYSELLAEMKQLKTQLDKVTQEKQQTYRSNYNRQQRGNDYQDRPPQRYNNLRGPPRRDRQYRGPPPELHGPPFRHNNGPPMNISQQNTDPNLCYYHATFGDKAYKCKGVGCAMAPQNFH